MSACVVCGAATNGSRCREHWHQEKALRFAAALADQDRELLSLHDSGVSVARLAVRYGRSRMRIYQRLRDARRRQRLLVDGIYERGPVRHRKKKEAAA